MEGRKRTYIVYDEDWCRERWGGDSLVEEVSFGLASLDGGDRSMAAMQWHDFDDGLPPATCLQAFSDAWPTMLELGDLMERLRAVPAEGITREEFTAILDACGFEEVPPSDTRDDGGHEADAR